MAILSFGLSSALSAQNLLTHDFDDGSFGGFERTYSSMSNRVTIVDGAIQCHWWEGLYDGGNTSKKSEFRAIGNDYSFTQEFWTGFWLKVHSNTFANNPNTEMSLMQIWGFRADGGANHYVMLKYYGDGSLGWQHRYNMGSNFTLYNIQDDFPTDRFVKVVIRVKLQNTSDGIVQVWLDDELKLNKTGQTIGFGDQNANGQHSGSYSTPGSWGIYAYNNGEYVNGETRTVTYDDVSLWNGPNGYDIVNPGGTTIPTPECDDVDAFSTIQAENYCDMSGVQTENSSDDGGSQVGYIQDGDWIKFEDVDFGSGVGSFDARVSSATSGGNIELRLGSPSGNLIGTCPISGTGSWMSYKTESCVISGASGVQDLYLVFRGGAGYLLNLNWFTFGESVGYCSLPWSDNDFSVESETVNYSSGSIDISCASSVDIFMNLEGVGNMEDADYLKVYYKVDGGAQQVISENVNAFSEKTVSVSGIQGNRLEILANVYTSYAGEVYTVSDISVATESQASNELAVASVYASTHDGNTPSNTQDDNLNTRWSALGDLAWVSFDLGSNKTVTDVGVAFYKGDQRTATINIETSTDNNTWETVYSGEQPGSTTAIQNINVTETTARYVRIVGYGNTVNNWNSLTEVKIYGR